MRAWTWRVAGFVSVGLMCAPGPIREDGAGCRGRASDRGCLSCHHFDRALSHPVDIAPSRAVPPELPLADGLMTCLTCHDGPGAVPTEPAALCAGCHDRAARRLGDLHALALGRAHIAERVGPGRATGSFSARRGDLDRESESCLACHDGAVASLPGIRMGRQGSPASRMLGGRHPIGVVQQPRGVGDTLVPAHLLDRRIRLFDGRVGCGSCHTLYAGEEALLVMSNQGSALCLSCHDF